MEAIRPVGRTLLRDRACEAIRDAIVSGEIEPGAVVRDVDLAERLGLSRAPVREAFARVTYGTAGVHLSFDLDGVDPEDAPGVGTPVPGGLDLRESHLVCETAAASGKLLGMEVVELNPTLDNANKTGRLAVWLVQSALGKTIL